MAEFIRVFATSPEGRGLRQPTSSLGLALARSLAHRSFFFFAQCRCTAVNSLAPDRTWCSHAATISGGDQRPARPRARAAGQDRARRGHLRTAASAADQPAAADGMTIPVWSLSGCMQGGGRDRVPSWGACVDYARLRLYREWVVANSPYAIAALTGLAPSTRRCIAPPFSCPRLSAHKNAIPRPNWREL
jgi:hypothetical protein